jgi:hypothetical protein
MARERVKTFVPFTVETGALITFCPTAEIGVNTPVSGVSFVQQLTIGCGAGVAMTTMATLQSEIHT